PRIVPAPLARGTSRVTRHPCPSRCSASITSTSPCATWRARRRSTTGSCRSSATASRARRSRAIRTFTSSPALRLLAATSAGRNAGSRPVRARTPSLLLSVVTERRRADRRDRQVAGRRGGRIPHPSALPSPPMTAAAHGAASGTISSASPRCRVGPRGPYWHWPPGQTLLAHCALVVQGAPGPPSTTQLPPVQVKPAAQSASIAQLVLQLVAPQTYGEHANMVPAADKRFKGVNCPSGATTRSPGGVPWGDVIHGGTSRDRLIGGCGKDTCTNWQRRRSCK